MKLAVSNIALPAHDHAALLPEIAALGFSGLEVAPSRVWSDTWHGLEARAVEAYRRAVEAAGLTVTGIHSLFFDQPEMTIFGDDATRTRTLEFLVHLSAMCRDLGGRVMVFGSPPARRRGDLAPDKADVLAVDFFNRFHDATEDHGTVMCLEPLGPADTDFCGSMHEILSFREQTQPGALGLQIDARALTAHDEITPGVFARAQDGLVHVHANATDLGELLPGDAIDHPAVGRLLAEIGYDGFVSLEQRMVDETDPLGPVARSIAVMKEAYQ